MTTEVDGNYINCEDCKCVTDIILDSTSNAVFVRCGKCSKVRKMSGLSYDKENQLAKKEYNRRMHWWLENFKT